MRKGDWSDGGITKLSCEGENGKICYEEGNGEVECVRGRVGVRMTKV